IARVYRTGEVIRRKIVDPDCPNDFPVLVDLRAEQVTDYLASPLVFSNGDIHAVTCTTRQPGGFTDAQIAALEAVMTPLARVAEIRGLRRLASNLLDTYVGHDAGERILAGHIRRGDIEEIHAAIWLSDMRGFTALADRQPPRVLIDLLNRYFDCQVPVILDHGAEVLKFMGDGLLAIFAIAGDETEVCKRALAAARQVQANVADLAKSAMQGLRFGLALHIGDVLYGNIGSGNRLDFTCIGPAVNFAARIEKLTSQVGREILASGEFARHCRGQFTALGEFSLPGFSAAQQVFGLENEAPAVACCFELVGLGLGAICGVASHGGNRWQHASAGHRAFSCRLVWSCRAPGSRNRCGLRRSSTRRARWAARRSPSRPPTRIISRAWTVASH